jgi:hypothetical protein
MDAERDGSVTDALLIARVSFLDVELLEFFERLVQQDVAVEHVLNDCFEAGAYLHSVRRS